MFSPGTVRSVIEYGQPLSFFTTCTRIFHANSERDSTEGEMAGEGVVRIFIETYAGRVPLHRRGSG